MGFKINHLHFKTPDPRKTAQWYVDNLGAKIVSEVGTGFRMDLHGIPLNVTGFLEGQNIEQFYGLEHVALDTDDLPGVVGQLKASGCRILLEEERGGPGRSASSRGQRASASRSWRLYHRLHPNIPLGQVVWCG